MIEEFKMLINEPANILIQGPAGAGKSVLAMKILTEEAKKEKRCVLLSFLQGSLIINGMKNLFPELEELLGKYIFLGYIQPVSEEEFLEDVEYAVRNLRPQVILIDPLYPGISKEVFRDVCTMLKALEITGIFCYKNKSELSSAADYVIEISMERIGDKIKRSLIVKSSDRKIEKVYSFGIIENKVLLEEI